MENNSNIGCGLFILIIVIAYLLYNPPAFILEKWAEIEIKKDNIKQQKYIQTQEEYENYIKNNFPNIEKEREYFQKIVSKAQILVDQIALGGYTYMALKQQIKEFIEEDNFHTVYKHYMPDSVRQKTKAFLESSQKNEEEAKNALCVVSIAVSNAIITFNNSIKNKSTEKYKEQMLRTYGLRNLQASEDIWRSKALNEELERQGIAKCTATNNKNIYEDKEVYDILSFIKKRCYQKDTLKDPFLDSLEKQDLIGHSIK